MLVAALPIRSGRLPLCCLGEDVCLTVSSYHLSHGTHKLTAALPCRYRTPSQQHFYMDPQAAIVVPGVDDNLTVHHSV